MAAIIEAREDAFSTLHADLGEGSRLDIEKEVMPVLQPQKAADEISDHPPVGEGNDGFGGIGGDPPGNGSDPFAEVAEALAVREGKVFIKGGPALDNDRVGGGDLRKTRPLPAAEIDLPKVGVDVADIYSAEGNFGRLTGPSERAAEEMYPVQTPELPGKGRRLTLPSLGEGHVGPADVTSAAGLPQIAVTDQDYSFGHGRCPENKKSPRLSTWGCRISSSIQFRSATPLHGGHHKQENLRAGLLASGSTSGRVFPSLSG